MTSIECRVGARLRRLRVARRMTLRQLGEAMRQHRGRVFLPQAIWQAEHGLRDLRLAELAAFAAIFETTVGELVDGPIVLSASALARAVNEWNDAT